MKPPPFDYHAPRTVDDAVGLLSTLENAKLLAGGQSLMAMLNLRYVFPDHLIDLNRIPDLAFIEASGGRLRIGAMARQHAIQTSPVVASVAPILCQALSYVGHRPTRNRGTIGGSLSNLDPSAELPAMALLYDASVEVAGPRGRRVIAMADFAVGFMTPAIEADEIVTCVDFPVWSGRHGHGFQEFARRHGDYAIGAAGSLVQLDGAGRIARVAIAVAGTGSVAARLRTAEASLIGMPAGDEALRIASAACAELPALDDAQTTAAYRRGVAAAMVRRSLKEAIGRAEGSSPGATKEGAAA